MTASSCLQVPRQRRWCGEDITYFGSECDQVDQDERSTRTGGSKGCSQESTQDRALSGALSPSAPDAYQVCDSGVYC